MHLKNFIKPRNPARGGVDALHLKGWYSTEQDDDKPLDVKQIRLNWEGNSNVGFLTEDIPRRLFENWATNRVVAYGWMYVYRRKFLTEYCIEFPKEHIYSEDHAVLFDALCFAKKYLMLRDSVTIFRVRKESLSHKADTGYGIKGMLILMNRITAAFKKVPVLKDNRFLKDQCIMQSLEVCIRDHARPLYNGVNIPIELDKTVYETLLPIFGENTTLVKHLFHGYNNMWRQANILAQQNYFLRQREGVIQKQNKLIEQMKRLLNQYDEKI